MNLQESIQKIIQYGSYDTNWGVYAEPPFEPESPARFGQTCFEGGGVLDGKELVASNMEIIDAAWSYCDGNPLAADCPFDLGEIATKVLEELTEI